MFWFLPLGVEGLTLRRIPWVSIVLAALMAVGFAVTWLPPSARGEVPVSEVRSLWERWEKRPYLELPTRFLQRLPDEAVEYYRHKHTEAQRLVRAPKDALEEQEALNATANALVDRTENALLHRAALVPARGYLQLGLLTHAFVHFGWFHLIGNLLFFYIVALLLEDIWGRIVFPIFYLSGALFAATAHYLLDPGSTTSMVGASGAVAACMGAFAVRFATARIRLGYLIFIFVRIFRGSWLLPAWLLGAAWFASELLGFLSGSAHANGVAVMAHLGGFAFGVGAALLLKVSQVEERLIAPELERRDTVYARDPALDEAERALDQGDLARARQVLTALVTRSPDYGDGVVALAKLELGAGEAPAAMRRVQALFTKLVAEGATARLWQAAEELGAAARPELLRPQLAFKVGAAFDEAPDGIRGLAEAYFVSAGRAPGPLGAKAWLRAAQTRLAAFLSADVAMDYLARAKATHAVPPELAPQLAELERRASSDDPRFTRTARAAPVAGAIELEEEPAAASVRPSPHEVHLGGAEVPEYDLESGTMEEGNPRAAAAAYVAARPPPPPPATPPTGPSGPPRIVPCRLQAMSAQALTLQTPAGERSLDFGQMLAVAVGVAGEPQPGGKPPRTVVFTDLVVSWGGPGAGPTVLRLPGYALGLGQLYPAMSPPEAYGEFLSNLLGRSHAKVLPDAAAVRRGAYPKFTSPAEMTAKLYGPAPR